MEFDIRIDAGGGAPPPGFACWRGVEYGGRSGNGDFYRERGGSRVEDCRRECSTLTANECHTCEHVFR